MAEEKSIIDHLVNAIKEGADQEENRILKAALAQLRVWVFVYDIAYRRLYFLLQEKDSAAIRTEYTLEQFLDNGMLDEEYAAVAQELFEKTEQGVQSVEARVKFQKNKKVYWCDMAMSRCADGTAAAYAIGTIQDTTSLGETKMRFHREKEYREAMLADCRRVYEINVTKDRFTKLESIQDSTDTGEWKNYTQEMNWLRENKVHQEDWPAFLDIADRSHLLRGYEEGKTEFYCEYRVINGQGDYTWSSSATHLLQDPVTDDVKGFIYIKDIDRQKRWELELTRQAERDQLTGIYNRRMAERLITEKLQEAKEEKRYGFLMIDIDDFKFVNDNFGHAKGDLMLQKMSRQIDMLIGEQDIFARLGGDEFIVFLEESREGGRVKRIADLICDMVRGIRVAREQKFQPSVSIGIASYPECGGSFKELYETADQALYHVKRYGKNYADFYRN